MPLKRAIDGYTRTYSNTHLSFHETAPLNTVQIENIKSKLVVGSVSDPDSFFTDPDLGLFSQSGSGQQKPIFLRQKQNFGRNFCFQPKK